jgi:hypothetical protein
LLDLNVFFPDNCIQDLTLSSWNFLEHGLIDFETHLPKLQQIQGRLYVVEGFDSIYLNPADVLIGMSTTTKLLKTKH